MEKTVVDKNLFMMCLALNPPARTDMPDAFHVRRCRRDELSDGRPCLLILRRLRMNPGDL